ncbi:MAG: leucine-rich repeat domain-containing protein [Clostridia bacterium]|nr:leucine-rich repeat domain-containing protein [Clostridia bacterium]
MPKIPESAFSGMMFLKNINIPESVNKIEKLAFNNCGNLQKVEFDTTLLDSIGDYAFANSMIWSLTSMRLPEGISIIGNSAFENCAGLTNIIFPKTIKYLKQRAFAGSGLLTVKIPKSIEIVPKEAFCNCIKLQSVQLDSGVKIIDDSAFENYERLHLLSVHSFPT